jgi:hypothetical protein
VYGGLNENDYEIEGAVMVKLVFQSGDNEGADDVCYNCGKSFADSAAEKDITSGSVVAPVADVYHT